MRQAIAGCLLIGSGIALTWIFTSIYVYGKFIVIEPNNWILAVELAMSLGIIVYGVVRYRDAVKK